MERYTLLIGFSLKEQLKSNVNQQIHQDYSLYSSDVARSQD